MIQVTLTEEQAAWLKTILDDECASAEEWICTTAPGTPDHQRAMSELDMALNIYYQILNPAHTPKEEVL